MSLSAYLENKLLDHLRGVPYAPPAGLYVQNHVGDPGEAGLLRQAANKERQQALFDAADGGVMKNSAVLSWAKLPAAETYSHFSVWDALSAGNCLGSGWWEEPRAYSVGDTAMVDPGTLIWILE